MRRHFVDPESLQVEERRGLLVTSRVRTVLDLAAFGSIEQAVTAVDHVLRPARNGPPVPNLELLEAGIAGIYRTAAARRIITALEFGNPASGSPGESVSRAMMHRLGFKAPVLQYGIRDARGLVGFTDFEWPEDGLSGEFDGLVKYRDAAYLKGRTPSDVVIEEKSREDRIRATGRRVIRWTWSELASPERFAAFLDAQGVPRRPPGIRYGNGQPPRGFT